MTIRHLTLFLTDACNFSCSYCLRRKKNRHMSKTTADAVLDRFLPNFSRAPTINFYGGEPLLRFKLLKHIVGRLQGESRMASCRPRFALTTNGSLVTPDVLEFLENSRFSVTLSFDGPAQDIHRHKGSFGPLSNLVRSMTSSRKIKFEINTVVTPAGAENLMETVQFLWTLGARNIRLSPALNLSWKPAARAAYRRGLSRLRRRLSEVFLRTGHVSVLNFRENPEPGLFQCGAGKNRIAVTTGGEIWGCHLFADYGTTIPPREKRKYLMGHIKDIRGHFPSPDSMVLQEYSRLAQDAYSVRGKSCLFCSHNQDCSICPMSLATLGRPLESIPLYACELQRIRIAEVRKFHEMIHSVRVDPRRFMATMQNRSSFRKGYRDLKMESRRLPAGKFGGKVDSTG
ncbi:MAG: radical SAM protein [Acidobacteriota bacterium]|nr:radical SAM protein [Acidobacteriota bacterium]